MIRVRAASRLHFGLFNVGLLPAWPNIDGDQLIPGRRFGGVGMMVDLPGIEVRSQPAGAWSASGPMAERALAFAQRFATTAPELRPQHIEVATQSLPHVGLGTGTQLALGVAKALAVLSGHTEWGAVELARRVGRGLRSAIGIHGFDHGGFLVEAGKHVDSEVSPLVARCEVPSAWRILLMAPHVSPGYSGDAERMAFDVLLQQARPQEVESLCRLVLLGMLPALAAGDCRAFGEAVYDFNARAGDIFASQQGGRYAPPLVGEIVKYCRDQGISGVGQSSWGPTVFAILPDEMSAERLRTSLACAYGRRLEQVFIAKVRNCGATVSET